MNAPIGAACAVVGKCLLRPTMFYRFAKAGCTQLTIYSPFAWHVIYVRGVSILITETSNGIYTKMTKYSSSEKGLTE